MAAAGNRVEEWFERFIYTAAQRVPDTTRLQQPINPDSGASTRSQQYEYYNRLTRNSAIDWTAFHSLNFNKKFKRKDSLELSTNVFGFHPYWMGEAWQVYDFSLLSHLAYFSYELQADGNYSSIHDWNSTGLIDTAHSRNPQCKVLLTVNSFTSSVNTEFLNSSAAQDRLITNLITLISGRNGDGVALDFENVAKSDGQAFTNFVKKLSLTLKDTNESWQVLVTLPAIHSEQFDIPSLSKYVDLFMIMGYDFYGSFSTVAGPVSPLYKGTEWWSSLDQSLQSYIAVSPDPSKLLMGLPYYGSEWYTETTEIGAKVASNGFIDSPIYRSISSQILKGAKLDSSGYTQFYPYKSNDGRTAQLWFDDSATLGAKYDWVKAQNIGGIGIWALGYDNGKTELWALLETEFAAPPDTGGGVPLPPDTTDTAGFSWSSFVKAALPVLAKYVSLGQIVRYAAVLILIFAAILWFMTLLGGDLVKVLTNWLKKLIYFYLLFIVLFAIFRLLSLIGPTTIWWLFGFMTATLLAILIVRSYINSRPLP